MTAGATGATVDAAQFATTVARRVDAGQRFAGLVASAGAGGSTVLRALLAGGRSLDALECRLAPGVRSYPSVTPLVAAANWYEREIHDLHGVVAAGHPRLDPLVLPLPPGETWRPGADGAGRRSPVELDRRPLPATVAGEGVFTIPYGPVRSGIFESIEYLVESYGEDIPNLRTRVYQKHRGLESRFGTLAPGDGVLLAERVEGTASVAHATAFAQALEALAGVEVPRPALLVRLLHAELERVAGHLDSVIRHTEAAGQAVASARIGLHKERLMRLRAQLCGHRFGRGVVVPGGVSGPPAIAAAAALGALARIDAGVSGDTAALSATPSFLDRLRRTGIVPPEVAAAHGALGPVGRGSGVAGDVRAERPYGAYPELAFEPVEVQPGGDALARQLVRLDEIRASFDLARRALDALAGVDAGAAWRADPGPAAGVALGCVEAPQGELVYLVESDGERLLRVKPRTASFHNLALLPRAFGGDILTDFAFIEASFALSTAGVAG